mgnify:CR=1 FL=1
MDKTLVTRSTGMLLLKLIENEDMYGYQMIEELARRSDDTFTLKAVCGKLLPHRVVRTDSGNAYGSIYGSSR